MENENDLKGLKGWLIIVGLGVVFSPIRLLITLLPVYIPIFEDNVWATLTTPGSEVYHPFWEPLLVGEIIYNSVLITMSVYLIYLFFTKHHLFPKLYIVIVVASLIFIPLDAWIVTFILPDAEMFDPATIKEFTRTIISVVVWVPYMLFSKRVAATFVKKEDEEIYQELI